VYTRKEIEVRALSLHAISSKRKSRRSTVGAVDLDDLRVSAGSPAPRSRLASVKRHSP
jgi:hypothetical protein